MVDFTISGSGEGWGRESWRPGGIRVRELAPGEGMTPGQAGAREGTRPVRAGARERDAAVSATTPAGCGRARDGRVGGERRTRRKSAAGLTKESRDRHRGRSSSRRRRERHRSSRLLQASRSRDHGLTPYGVENSCSASRALDPALRTAGECDVPGVFVTGPVSRASLSGRTFTEVGLRVGLPSLSRPPHVPGVSWRPHPAGVATSRPGRCSDGRLGPGRRRLSDG